MHEEDAGAEQSPHMQPAESMAPDVSGKSLLDLLNEPESDVAAGVRELLRQRTHREDQLSSWSSFLG
ncbi:hypothetical protein [Mangrovihabitans endophyticus]|uniref:Uncharacterized protein n=1 Tax=Mangrovihabitans endophyticus TaxID=1751298 RepID=A0A8J3C5R2_9ACTN|nr:hypothetical protein [Mangrovihabitans endophyticus]GGL13080.1 hypothetical protein GCM10012284_54670 [Mangrovihabitans endophyticus]